MTTEENATQYRNGVYSKACDYWGLSTDTKPTGDTVGNGSRFLEMDTAKIYLYDADGAEWREWGA